MQRSLWKQRHHMAVALIACALACVPGCGLRPDQLRDLGLGGLAAAILLSLLNNNGAGDGGAGNPIPGADGINCWDLNQNGVADPAEDTNGDGTVDVLDCRGADGQDGQPGQNGQDGQDGLDGHDGSNGGGGGGSTTIVPSLFSVFITDFFTNAGRGNASLPVDFVSIVEPALGSTALGAADAIAFRTAIPNGYEGANPVSMRLFFYRTGATDGCFAFSVKAARLRNGSAVEPYGDERFVRVNMPHEVNMNGGVAGVTSFEQFVTVDLPINREAGLGLPNDLEAGQFLAFELSTLREDGGLYELLGVEFYETQSTPEVADARIFENADEVTCFDCPEDGVLTRSYTLDADFAAGNLFNVNFDTPDQLQLNEAPDSFPYLWVAASERGTIVRIDVNTGNVLGEYLTAPDGRERYPWRVAVDRNGSAWVANADESGGGHGSITRIALPDSGLCVDRNDNGTIDTSVGLADIRPWLNAGGVDDDGGVATAQDECITNYARPVTPSAGALAVDLDNDAWVGGAVSRVHQRIGGDIGAPVLGSDFNLSCGGYDALVDANGVLWSASNGKTIMRYDTTTGTGECIEVDGLSYGLAVDPATGHIWNTTLFGNQVFEFAPDGTLLNTFEHGDEDAEDVAVDHDGNVWVAHSIFGDTVGHLTTDGTLVGNVPLSFAGGSGPTGLAVDVNGKIWVTNANTDNVMRIDPQGGITGGGGRKIGAVDLVVDLGAGAGPANLGDMAGFESSLPSTHGSWSTVIDGEIPETAWLHVAWNEEGCVEDPVPEGTSMTVEVRAAESTEALNDAEYISVENGDEFDELIGRYLQVRISLDGDDVEGALLSPVLCDFSIEATCTAPGGDIAN